MNITFLHLVLFIAATWRMSNLIVHEEGPFLMFARLRKNVSKSRARWIRRFGLVQLLNCEYCVSVWFGTALTWAYGLTVPGSVTGIGWFVLPLALSAGAIIIKHVVFLIKSVDTRFDQQNQDHIAFKQLREQAIVRPDTQQIPTPGTPEWDALVFDQHILERR